MSVLLGIVGVLICLVLIANGYLMAVLIGGVLGSFVGIAVSVALFQGLSLEPSSARWSPRR